MNILYHFRTRGTGAEAVHISGIVQALEKMGHQVILSSPTGVDVRQTAGSTPFSAAASGSRGWIARLVDRLPRGLFEVVEFLYNVPAYVRNRRLLRRHDCRLIYERHAFFLFSTALLARLYGRPLVVEVNELIGDSRVRAQPVFSWLGRWTDRFVFRRARLIVVVSPYLKRRVVREYGISEDKVLVLPNGISAHNAGHPARSAFIAHPAAGFLLGFVGWMVEWHRLDFVIEALAAPEFSAVELVIIGEGPLQSTLAAQAGTQGVRVRFVGALPHAEIPAALREMDACVVPHSNEYRSPIKLFEYMAQERPILAPRTEPIETVLTHGVDGLLFTPLDVESFRGELRKLLVSNGLRESIGKAARRTVEEKYTWERNALRIMESAG
jgi:glycosyltransferase involved in cell wall biosynthesis